MHETEHAHLEHFLSVNDYADNSRAAIRQDFSKFVRWFEAANREAYADERVTPRDIADFRRHLREVRRQAVASTNRALCSLRSYFAFLVGTGAIAENPADGIKELRRALGPPKAIERAAVRKMLREATLRSDHRGLAILSLMLYCGLRVGEVAALELGDIEIRDRSGSVRVRHGKGRKERVVPLAVEVRRSLQSYLDVRPPVRSPRLLVGRGGSPLGTDGVRYVVRKYGTCAGLDVTPHQLRHTMGTEYLAATGNDLVGLAQLLGHESIQTTSRYTQRSRDQLAASAERLAF